MVVWVIAPDPSSNPQAHLPATDANHVFRQIPLAQGQADRSPDQSNANDSHISKLLHQSIPEDVMPRRTIS